MATIITSAAPSPACGSGSAIEHAAAAGSACIERASIGPSEVDVLINVGVYRDFNIVEPSVAALIQKRIGINLDYASLINSRPAFSFDLMNGACGLLNAVQAADALLSTETARRVLVVSSDSHPSTDASLAGTEMFPYASTGAALLLERTADTRGFGGFHHCSSLTSGFGVHGYLPVAEVGSKGRSTIFVDRDNDATEGMLSLAVGAVGSVLSQERASDASDSNAELAGGLDLDRVLLVTSQPFPGFPAQLAKRLDLASDAAVTVEGVLGDPHTSALIHGYCQAHDAGRLGGYDAILFLTVGSGLTSTASLYRFAGAADGTVR